MNHNEHKGAQPLRELTWLANYFKEHGREDLAQQIFQQIRLLRHRAQSSLISDASDIIEFKDRRRKSEGSD